MLVAAILLLLGIVRISLWFNSEIAQRQSAYNATRLEAGSDIKGEWPVYARKNLTEGWVLGGQSFTNQSGGKTSGEGITSGNRGYQCENDAEVEEKIGDAQDKKDEADALNAEADTLENEAAALDIQAEAYQTQYDACISNLSAYEVYCSSYCEALVAGGDEEISLSQCDTCCDYLKQAEDCRKQAEEKRQEAENKRAEAESLQKEAANIMIEANDLNEECMKDRN